MAQKINVIRNADFSMGKEAPRGWSWSATSRKIRSQRADSPDAGRASGIQIVSETGSGRGGFTQEVACLPDKWYRVEATVTCDLRADGDRSGLVLELQPLRDGKPAGRLLATPSVHRASEPVAVRAIFTAPTDIRRLRITVAVVDAEGTATVHSVRLIRTIEPDSTSHPLAIPRPRHSMTAPRVAANVCVCSDTAGERRLTSILSGCLGKRRVHSISPAQLAKLGLSCDALLLPDAVPPSSIRSLGALEKLAADRLVVISLPAFAKLAKERLQMRRIEQEDDPICAKIAYGNFATHGFAMNDVFPYAWCGKTEGSFVQNQFRSGKKLQEFCKRHGLETLLLSMCDTDKASNEPISLFKLTPKGGLFVLDLDPIEEPTSTFGEPNLAFYLLRSILGHTQAGLGQYTVPLPTEPEFRAIMRDLQVRFSPFTVHEADVPIDEAREQLVTIGAEGDAFGLPLRSKPVIIIRSGLESGQVEGAYGALVWIKQLIRMLPHECAYAEPLTRAFRVAWVPSDAAWEGSDGWLRSGAAAERGMAIETEDATVAAVIDLVARPVHRCRIVLPSLEGSYRRYAHWMPQLAEAFPAGSYFAHSVPPGATFNDRDLYDWRFVEHAVEVVADAQSFDAAPYDQVMRCGGEVIRIEVPGNDADFAARSIERTGLVATLLEHVIGLQYGLIAVNRLPKTVTLDGFQPIKPGQALILDQAEPMLSDSGIQAG